MLAPAPSLIPSPRNILILCTGNSARSILGEALINHLGAGRFRGYSAGSQPTGAINPLALATLAAHGIAYAAMRSKSWDEFTQADAPRMDFIITVCDSAAAEPCPYFPGDGLRAHWGIEDPSHIEGSAAIKRAAFEQAFEKLHRKVNAFIALPDTLEQEALRTQLVAIGQMQ